MAGPVAEAAVDKLRVYSRPGCHLCEQLIEELLPLVRGRLEVEVVDIDDREDWHDAYCIRIPVVEYAGEFVCQYTLDRQALERVLAGIVAPRA